MALTLVQSRAMDDLMLLLVDWLPGSSPWGAYTFADAAAENGVGEFWRGGSKKPALTELLRLTYERESERFCPLVLTIVDRGMSYRRQKDWPVQRADVEGLNGIIGRLGFKIPELWDSAFLDSLPGQAQESTPEAHPAAPPAPPDPRSSMPALHDRFLLLYREPDRAKAGREFEPLLNDLFAAWDLAPSQNYRVVGEEIDNSIVLDGDTYLLEAKWNAGKTEAPPLYTFRQKVASKSAYTRGLFIAVEGFTAGAITALGSGQETPHHPLGRNSPDARVQRRRGPPGPAPRRRPPLGAARPALAAVRAPGGVGLMAYDRDRRRAMPAGEAQAGWPSTAPRSFQRLDEAGGQATGCH